MPRNLKLPSSYESFRPLPSGGLADEQGDQELDVLITQELTQPDLQDIDALSGPSQPTGLRERKKRAKERHIRSAARALFVRNGYEATTLREVASEAKVGFGTVFAYANDKAGLLAMIFVEELKLLPPLFEEPSEGDVLEDLVSGLSHLYAFWASIPTLSSNVLQQMEFYGGNPHVEQIVARRRAARGDLEKWLRTLAGAGSIDPEVDTELAADTLFAIYTSAVREWSATDPGDVQKGIDRLRDLMRLPVRALSIASLDTAL